MEKLEYEIQHFGLSAKQLGLERRHMMKKCLTSLLTEILKSFIKKANLSKKTAHEVQLQLDKVVDKIFGSFSEKLQQIDDLDSKNFQIPDNVLLHQDYAHAKRYTQSDEDNLDADLVALKQTFFENAINMLSLEMENSKYAEIENIIEEELVIHKQIQETFEAIDVQEMQAMLGTSLEKIPNTNLKL